MKSKMMYASTKDLIKGFMDGVSAELQVRPSGKISLLFAAFLPPALEFRAFVFLTCHFQSISVNTGSVLLRRRTRTMN